MKNILLTDFHQFLLTKLRYQLKQNVHLGPAGTLPLFASIAAIVILLLADRKSSR